jgi:hypothetical protein
MDFLNEIKAISNGRFTNTAKMILGVSSEQYHYECQTGDDIGFTYDELNMFLNDLNADIINVTDFEKNMLSEVLTDEGYVYLCYSQFVNLLRNFHGVSVNDHELRTYWDSMAIRQND